MTASQRIDLVMQDQNAYETEITVTDVPQGHFLAVLLTQ